jgi:hypothetical protein
VALVAPKPNLNSSGKLKSCLVNVIHRFRAIKVASNPVCAQVGFGSLCNEGYLIETIALYNIFSRACLAVRSLQTTCRFIPKKRNTHIKFRRDESCSHSVLADTLPITKLSFQMARSSTLALSSFLLSGRVTDAHVLSAALIFLKECAIISAAGLLPGRKTKFLRIPRLSSFYVINDAESHHGLPTFGPKKASRRMSRNLLENHVAIAPLVLALKFKVAVIVLINLRPACARKGRISIILLQPQTRNGSIHYANTHWHFITTNYSSVSLFKPFAKL